MRNKNCPRRDFMKGGIVTAAGVGVFKAFGGASLSDDLVKSLAVNRVVRIPADYPTLQDAVQGESQLFPLCSGEPRVTIAIHIESGYRIKSGMSFENGSFGHFVITSDDDVVEVADDYSGHFIHVQRAIGPVLATLVDMRHKWGNGYYCVNAIGQIEEASVAGKLCGIRNAGRDGVLSAHGSSIRIASRDEHHTIGRTVLGGLAGHDSLARRGAEISGSGRFNIHCMGGSFVSASSAILTHSRGTNVLATHSSKVSCDHADCSGAAEIGIRANGASQINAAYAKAARCGQYGLGATHCSAISAVGAEVFGSASQDIWIRTGGMIDVSGVRTTHGTPSIQDTNVQSFNTLSGRGILFNDQNSTP